MSGYRRKMKTRMRPEAARAELAMLNSRAVLASSTAPFRSLTSFLSRTWCQKEVRSRQLGSGHRARGRAAAGGSGASGRGLLRDRAVASRETHPGLSQGK